MHRCGESAGLTAGYKSSDIEGLRKAKAAALVQLLSSAVYDRALILCEKDDDATRLATTLGSAGLSTAVDDQQGKPSRHDSLAVFRS